MARNGFSEEEATQRLRSQRPWQDRAPAADFVIHNNGAIDAVKQTVRRELDRVSALAAAGALPPSVFQAWWEERRAALAAQRAGQQT